MHNFIIGPTDTDSISFCKPDMSPFTKEELSTLLAELNDLSPEFMDWSDDGYYKKFIVVRAKNYVMLTAEGDLTVKGSALKATTKEKALKRFINEVIDLLLEDQALAIPALYMKYARDIMKLTDMTEWSSKHTITKSVLTGKGTTQVRIRQALKGRPVQEGDKKYFFFKTDEERCLLEDFDGTYDIKTLLGKLYDTVCVFETVIDVSNIPNLTLKRNAGILCNIG